MQRNRLRGLRIRKEKQQRTRGVDSAAVLALTSGSSSALGFSSVDSLPV